MHQAAPHFAASHLPAPHIPAARLPAGLIENQDTDLIAGFYAAAASAEDWSRPWSALCNAFNADTGLLYRQARPTASLQILASRNWPNAVLPAAEAGAWGDPASAGGTVVPIRLPAARPIPTMSLAAFDADEQPSPLAFHVLRATVPLDGTALVGMGLHRPADAPAFTETDRRALDGIGRHLASALRLEAMLNAARSASAIRASVLDLNPHGLVVCTGSGSLVFANRAARELADISLFYLDGGRACLGGLREAEIIRLEAMITSVAGGRNGGCVRIARGAGRSALAAIVEPLPLRMAEAEPALAHRGHDRSLVLISLRDLGATTDASPAHLMDLFGLTAAEAGIVPQLISGDSTSLIAQSRGVALSTVKSQAQKVLAKTGAPNLRALAAIMATIS